MTVTTIDPYSILKNKVGESQAQAIVEFVEREVKEMLDDNSNIYATKVDLKESVHQLELKLEKMRADIIKWMFIFWVGQTSLIITILMLFFK